MSVVVSTLDDAEVASVEFVGEMIAVRDDDDVEELGEMPE